MKLELHLYHHSDKCTERVLDDIQENTIRTLRKLEEILIITGGNERVRELIKDLNDASDELKRAVNKANKEK